MRRLLKTFATGLLFLGGTGFCFGTETFIVNDPAVPFINATALDQPRMDAFLTDGGVIMENDENETVTFRAFIDTGSSGFVLSNLIAEGHEDFNEPHLTLDETDYVGEYTNLGIGGAEVGWVSRPFGVLLHNGPRPEDGVIPLADLIPYGEHRLWVRQAPGVGEFNLVDVGEFQTPVISPVNIVGMPVIRQRPMVMEWIAPPEELFDLLIAFFPGTPETIRNVREMRTRLLPPGDPEIPATNLTLGLELVDFTGEPPAGETLPSFSDNPVVKNVTISHDPARESVTANWLFDTGAGSSFVGFGWAQTIGLIPESYPDLATFVVDHKAAGGMVSQIGGIGNSTIEVPILSLNEIRIPSREGYDLVWQNVQVLIFEHPELAALNLEGIFGMNLIGPAATVDATKLQALDGFGDGLEGMILLLTLIADATPTPFTAAVFEVTGEQTAELRLFSENLAPAAVSFATWSSGHFTEEELADPAISGPNADPDGDGIPNLLEYAMGSLPTAASRAHLPTANLVETDGQRFLTFTYERAVGATGIHWIFEASDDLESWSETNVAILETATLGERERVTVQATEPVGLDGRKFLRVRVDLAEE